MNQNNRLNFPRNNLVEVANKMRQDSNASLNSTGKGLNNDSKNTSLIKEGSSSGILSNVRRQEVRREVYNAMCNPRSSSREVLSSMGSESVKLRQETSGSRKKFRNIYSSGGTSAMHSSNQGRGEGAKDSSVGLNSSFKNIMTNRKDSIASANEKDIRRNSLYENKNNRSLSNAKLNKNSKVYTPTAKNTHPARGIYKNGKRRSQLQKKASLLLDNTKSMPFVILEPRERKGGKSFGNQVGKILSEQ
jgi:hypothetical protein